MAKLYWRVKINNKWTWIAADDENTTIVAPSVEAIAFAPNHWWRSYMHTISEEEE